MGWNPSSLAGNAGEPVQKYTWRRRYNGQNGECILSMNVKGNNGYQGHCCDNMI
jgi:hypothetical protein